MERERAELESKLEAANSERDEAAADRDTRISAIEDAMEKKEANDAKRRKRRRQLLGGSALILLGIALAVALPLMVVSSPGAVAGTIIGGAAFALVGLRILVGKESGSEIVLWDALLAALATIVTSIVLNNSGHSPDQARSGSDTPGMP